MRVDRRSAAALLGLALRRNPRRAQLLVSRVLGKHVPTDPRVVQAAGLLLGGLVADALAGRLPRASCRSALLHAAVRRARRGRRGGAAPPRRGDAVAPDRGRRRRARVRRDRHRPRALRRRGPRRRRLPALHPAPVAGVADRGRRSTRSTPTPPSTCCCRPTRRCWPGRARWCWSTTSSPPAAPRSTRSRRCTAPRRARTTCSPPWSTSARTRSPGCPTGCAVDVVALTRGAPHAAARPRRAGRGPARRAAPPLLPDGRSCSSSPNVSARAAAPARTPTIVPACRAGPTRLGCCVETCGWPAGLPAGGRHGFTAAHHRRAGRARCPGWPPTSRRGRRAGGERTLVLGTEELMYAAAAAGRRRSPTRATTSGSRPPPAPPPSPSTTPATPSAAARLPGPRRPGRRPRPPLRLQRRPRDRVGPRASSWSTRPADTPAAAHRAARRRSPRTPGAPTRGGHAVSTPEPLRGPAFGSYPPDEVAWLLTDLSDVALEAPTEEREEAIQSGGAHYAESLPHEYQPDAAVPAAVPRGAGRSRRARLAQAVGVVTELVLAERGPDVVLVSLARAGTPVGVLMRRWAAARHGLDAAALRRVDRARPRHRPGRAALPGRAPRPRPRRVRRRLDRQGRDHPRAGGGAARARPAVRPRARRARRPRPLRPHVRHPRGLPHPLRLPQLDGVRAGLAHRPQRPADRPRRCPRREVLRRARAGGRLHRLPRRGRRRSSTAVADTRPPARPRSRLRRAGRASNASRRRTASATSTSSSPASARPPGCCCAGCRGRSSSGPERAAADLAHVRLLAEQRGVPVEEVAELPYSCVGLIHPRFTRGATGADGRAVRAG